MLDQVANVQCRDAKSPREMDLTKKPALSRVSDLQCKTSNVQSLAD